MENASKALIMIGSVLISIIVVGALLLMINNLSRYQNIKLENDKEAEVIKFNNQYETYIRDDVRGSDLLSLLNKVVDYNRRQSYATTTAEGTNNQFKPMTIQFTIDNNYYEQKIISYDNKKRVFKKADGKYELKMETQNSIENMLSTEIQNLEDTYGNGLSNLATATAISNLYDIDPNSSIDVDKAIKLWNSNVLSSKKANTYSEINKNQYKEDIYKYYEYMQFKRIHFRCVESDCEYESSTGRITKMVFVCTGEVE